MSKLHWWHDDERDLRLAPRHSKALASNKDKHKVNDIRRMADNACDRFNDMLSLKLSKPLVYS